MMGRKLQNSSQSLHSWEIEVYQIAKHVWNKVGIKSFLAWRKCHYIINQLMSGLPVLLKVHFRSAIFPSFHCFEFIIYAFPSDQSKVRVLPKEL